MTSDEESGNESQDKGEEIPILENEVLMVEPPQPVLTIPLPQIVNTDESRAQSPVTAPCNHLISALQYLYGASIRMTVTRQLPFLCRNLRRGFHSQCSTLGIDTAESEKMTVLVRYECPHLVYEVCITRWHCPVCTLHGGFPNKVILRQHILWDHPEIVLVRWEARSNDQVGNCPL
ncbi:hypothetical protein P691DRAFT_493560 [Macrolepiota fuliginosa MF-IS2]|uniref:Uncharacterized protein n=1 Tax=Macrolepiota fuliginosa MF-IS2 TaxID=1400762 RepID=A0A9P5XIL4_9AGAR|nr:hypothetical protein P691DRAFT_493560 [Macrolepiota fuliginosa MF-IS2]